ncbi:NAD(P)-dependent oxidoreductase [Nitrosopumilus sp.]|uniref:NAD-dependent epimerase/dehydratase family protein n=1 Tax=Nitrosopumilus sp. TaxID=2024843 RepID=UPI00247B4B06|nr:NAD(P)-dependent oxidoreductase [Nitrosopumilus sp.]MCV0430398.1 NAD(P)-dependent oxidoreductase [Nitrosopumilus sp.]
MKILVTGASGQIGRILSKKIINEKIPYLGLDIRKDDSIDGKIIHSEITNNEDLKKHESELVEIDTLIHLASLITNDRDVIKNGPDSVELNIKGTMNLLKFLPNLKTIIFSSTYMVYGTPNENPVSELHITDPNVVYGASKLATEKYLQIFCKENNISLVILRMMGVYNVAKPHGQAIPTFVKMIANDQRPTVMGTGKIRRNHLYIDDAIESIMKSVKNPQTGIYNIGGKDSPSNLELIEIINNKMGKKIEPIFKETTVKPYDFITDISKAKSQLGFEPKIEIEEGIEKTIKNYLENKW